VADIVDYAAMKMMKMLLVMHWLYNLLFEIDKIWSVK